MNDTRRLRGRGSGAGQPKGELVDVEFVRERVATLHLDRREMLRRAAGRIAARTLQRVLNSPGTRLSLSSAAALGELLGCGCRDTLAPSPSIAERIARFDLLPPAPPVGVPEAARARWIGRPEEGTVEAGLEARRPVIVFGAAQSGKTSLARRVAEGCAQRYAHGALWIAGGAEAVGAQVRIVECLSLFQQLPDGGSLGSWLEDRFARTLWVRRRLLVVDDAADASLPLQLLGRYRGPMDLLVLTDRERVAIKLERELGERAVHLAPLEDEKVFAFLRLQHPGDGRLGAWDATDDAVLARALDGSHAELRETGTHLQRALASVPGWRPLLAAVAGRPGALLFGSDLLRTTRFTSVDEIARAVAASEEVNAPLLRHAGEDALRLFRRLALLGTEPAPVEWASVLADVPSGRIGAVCDELKAVLVHDEGAGGRSRVALAPYLQPYAAHALSGNDRAAAVRSLAAGALQELRAIASLSPDRAMCALHASEGGLLCALRHLVDPAGEREARLLVELLLAAIPVLPFWRREEVEPALRTGIERAAAAGLEAARPRLELTLGRWLVFMRSDFVGAETSFREAADGFAADGRPEEAAQATRERAEALFATLRTSLAVEAMRRAAALSRLARSPPAILAQRLVDHAFGETRLREGKDGKAGWRRAEVLLEEAAVHLRGEGRDGGLDRALAVAYDRAVVARVLGRSGWKRSLSHALRALLEDLPADEFARTYLLSTAIASGLTVSGSMAAQRRELRQAWRDLLESRGPAVGLAAQRLGQMAFYLNTLDYRDAAAWHANEGLVATDPFASRRPPGRSMPIFFLARPMRQVFDREFLEESARFLWEHGGPHQARLSQELDALGAAIGRRRKVAARAARA